MFFDTHQHTHLSTHRCCTLEVCGCRTYLYEFNFKIPLLHLKSVYIWTNCIYIKYMYFLAVCSLLLTTFVVYYIYLYTYKYILLAVIYFCLQPPALRQTQTPVYDLAAVMGCV